MMITDFFQCGSEWLTRPAGHQDVTLNKLIEYYHQDVTLNKLIKYYQPETACG